MVDQLVAAISRIGIFIVCAQVIVHCRPKAAYEKYIRLLVSVMVLLMLCQPILAGIDEISLSWGTELDHLYGTLWQQEMGGDSMSGEQKKEQESFPITVEPICVEVKECP